MKFAMTWLLGLSVLALAGCGGGSGKDGGGKTEKLPTPKVAKDDHDHHEHGKGPNGGVVFDFGKLHAELTIDHKAKECKILILGSDEKTPTAIAAKELTVTTKEAKGKDGKAIPPITVTLKPADEKDGKATKFVGTDPALANEAEHEGTLLGVVDGKPSEGKFKE